MFRRFDIRRGEENEEDEMSRTIISLPNELECSSTYKILLPDYQMIFNLKCDEVCNNSPFIIEYFY